MYNKQKILGYFRQFSDQLPKIERLENLIVVFGGQKAGKSVTVDLLSRKKMMLSEDLQSGVPTIVEENNWECQYDSMHKSFSKNSLIIQSLSIKSDIKNYVQISKFIVLVYLLRQFQKVGFVLVIQQTNLKSIQHQLQELLGILGLKTNTITQNIDIIQQYFHIIVSKSTKSIQQIIKYLCSFPQSNHIKILLQSLVKRQAVILFPRQYPSNDSFYLNISSKVKAIRSQSLKENITKNVSYASQIRITEQQQIQLIDFIEKLLVSLCNLIAYVKNHQKKYSVEYKKLMNQIFSSHLNKNNIQMMIQEISQYKKQNIKKTKENQFLYCMATAIMNILNEFKEKNPKSRKDYCCFIEILKLFIISMPFIDKNRLNTVQQKINPFQYIIMKRKDQIDQKYMETPRNIQNSTVYQIFKQLMLKNCKNNLDALKFCIQSYTKKHCNGQQFNVIITHYFLKILKNLLQLFMEEQYGQRLNFSLQMLQLCIISKNYYYFNNYLVIALQNHYLDPKSLDKLIEKLYSLQRYEECLKIIDYRKQFVTQCSHFQFLNQLKRLIFKVKIQECKGQKEKDNDDELLRKQQDIRIPFTFQSLKQRLNLLGQVLSSNHFIEMINQNKIY